MMARKRQHPDNPVLFWCPKCKTYKTKEEFYKSKNSFNGISGWCTECISESVDTKLAITRQHPNDKNLLWCPTCKTYRAKDEFGKSSGTCHERRWRCKECRQKDRRKYSRDALGKLKIHRRHLINDKLFWCNKCKTYKTKTEFHKTRTLRFGITIYCKECTNKKPEIKRCKRCGKEFSAVTIRKSFCSDDCMVKWNYKNRKLHRRVCEVCGAKFKTQNYIAKACSKECEHLLIFGKKIKVTCPICKETRMVHENANGTKWRKDDICHMCAGKKQNKKSRDDLKDGYIRDQIKKQLGFSNKDVTDEMIELKRQGILMHRNLKQFKQWRKQNESSNSDVQGKQHADEADHEGRISG